MDIKEFIEQLKLPHQVTNNVISESDTEIIYNLLNSDIFSKVYSILDRSELLDLDYDNIEINDLSTHMVYLSDDFDIILDADFENDDYNLIIERAE